MMMVGPRRPAAADLPAMSAIVSRHHYLAGAGAVFNDRDRQGGIGAVAQELRHQELEMGEAHIDRDRLARAQQGAPVEIDRAVATVAGDEDAGLRVIAMGQRDAGIGRASGGGGDAGADLERNALFGQFFDLLAAAPENEGVAALQAQHALALQGQLDHQVADLLLRQGVIGALLADIDALGVAAHPVHDRGVDQPVVEHHVGFLHQAEGPERQQVRVARPGAHQIDLADGMVVGGRAVGPAFGDFAVEQGLGAGFIARQDHFGDGAVINSLPEAQPRLMAGQLARQRRAALARERRQPAIGRRNQRFQAGLQHPAEQGRVAAGGNRHHQRAAVEHRGDDEIADAGMVGDIDQRPAGPGAGDQR